MVLLPFQVIGFLLLGFCFLIILACFFALIKQFRWKRKTCSTVGMVMDLVIRRGERNGGLVYSLTVQFPVAEAGSHEKVTLDFVSRPPRYRVGETAPILYDPTNPSQAQIPSKAQGYLIASFLAVFGGFCLIFALGFVGLIPASLLMFLPLVVPPVFIVVGVTLLVQHIHFQRKACLTEGVVIDLVRSRGGKGRSTYHPIVQFQTVEAGPSAMVLFESSSGSRPPSFQVGERVPVLYDPADPLHARIGTWTGWFFPSLLIVVGVGAFLLFYKR